MIRQIRLHAGAPLAATAGVVVVSALPAAAAAAGWVVQSTPNPRLPGGAGLAAVSCPSKSVCVAVGTGGTVRTTAVAERWNGSKWSLMKIAAPSRAAQTSLGSVSCLSGTACVAVGYYLDRAGAALALVERWNGTRWSIQGAPSPANDGHLLPHGISCASSTACMIVGDYSDRTGNYRLLAERWNGHKWTNASLVTPRGSQNDYLNGVSCTAANACTAVGSSDNATTTLVERWNGTRWSVQPSPARTGSELNSVSCVSAAACTAVGSYSTSTRDLALVEVWDGRRWTTVRAGAPPSPDVAILDAVSCPSRKSCIAVGAGGGNGGPDYLLAEGWNGARWSVQRVPDPPGSASSSLSGVACSSSRVCTAVGSGEVYGGAGSTTLAERLTD